MKRFTLFIVAMTCMLSLTVPCLAAPNEQIDAQREYFYSTSALNAYNFAHLYLYGTNIRIVRRGFQEIDKPDDISVLANQTLVLNRLAEWESGPVEGSYYGYDVELDMEGLEDGEYTLALESRAMKWVPDASGDSTGVRTSYKLASVRLVKQGAECYFPVDDSISSRYNNSLLHQLQQGHAPDDFTVLREYYSKQENSHILMDIEATVRELTAGLHSDLEKCLAIEQWMTQNIAYDFDFPRESIDSWLRIHPEDAARQEDALHAFENGYALCYGYARLTTLMLGYAGLDSVYVRGYHKNDIRNTWNSTEMSNDYRSSWNTGVPSSWLSRASDGTEVPDVYNHAWNAVKLSGSWYFLDTCKDAMYAYYRINSEDSNTAYIQLNQCYSGVYAFPAPAQISGTHIAIRYGADGYGEKLKDI